MHALYQREIRLSCFIAADQNIFKLWRDRFAHLNYESLKLLSTKEMVNGLPKIDKVEEVCKPCQLEKATQESISKKIVLERYLWKNAY